MTTKNNWTDINWPLVRVWVYKCLKTNSMDSPFNLPACSLFQLSGRKVNILPSYVIFHFVNVDIPRLCDISSFFFLLEFLKYISQHVQFKIWLQIMPRRCTSTIVLFFKKKTFDVFWYGGMPSWQKLGTFLQNWSSQSKNV